MKIYCMNCRYFLHHYSPISGKLIERCDYKLNIKYIDYPTFRESIQIKNPNKINKHNDCGWYTPVKKPKQPSPKPIKGKK